MDDPQASPLSWPFGRPRTPAGKRTRALFSRDSNHMATVGMGRHDLSREMRLLGVRDYLISTNLALRLDGEPRSGQGEPADPGVAVYFTLGGRPTVLACDRWDRVADNLRAIVKHIDSIRGQDRWGVGTIEQAFAGYVALPPPASTEPPERHWRDVMEFGPNRHVSAAEISDRYRSLAKERAGDEAALRELNIARDQAREEMA